MRLFGWEPVVYTAENPEIPVVDTSLEKEIPEGITILKTPIWEPYSIYKKFIGRKKEDKINASFLSENKKAGLTEKISVWIRGNFFIPDARKFWIKPSVKFLGTYLQENNIDCVISSGPPHSMHLIALGLKRKFPKIKWLADFRDPWTNIDFYEKLMLSPMADTKHHRLELEVITAADLVVSIGDSMSSEFETMYKKTGGAEPKFKCITNGFDSEDTATKTIVKDAKFSLSHIGTLVKDRNPEALWKVLKKLIEQNLEFKNALEIKLVGKVDVYVMDRLAYYGLSSFVRKVDYMPHNEVIEEQQRSRLLLLLVNDTKNSKGILTGKFFEYMASGSPILAIGPVDGELAKIMNETQCGSMSGFADELSLETNILAYFNGAAQKLNAEEVKKYDRKELTKQLCELLTTMN
jgi:glycosyltransferase involved in cell wall biosynthesis